MFDCGAFENLPAPLHFLEAPAGCDGAAIVSPKIDKRLFALKYGRRSEFSRPGPISSQIGAVAASRQSDFESARGIIVCLCPKKCETF
jgi:hypothetical protein